MNTCDGFIKSLTFQKPHLIFKCHPNKSITMDHGFDSKQELIKTDQTLKYQYNVFTTKTINYSDWMNTMNVGIKKSIFWMACFKNSENTKIKQGHVTFHWKNKRSLQWQICGNNRKFITTAKQYTKVIIPLSALWLEECFEWANRLNKFIHRSLTENTFSDVWHVYLSANWIRNLIKGIQFKLNFTYF